MGPEFMLHGADAVYMELCPPMEKVPAWVKAAAVRPWASNYGIVRKSKCEIPSSTLLS